MKEETTGIVYALRNAAMPGLVKIGRTSRSIGQRIREIYGTGVPLPFECIAAREVKEPEKLERALQAAFGPYRVNPSREFFEIQEEQIQSLLDAWPGKDAKPVVSEETQGQADEEAARNAFQRRRRKRPRLKFEEMGIPIGAELAYRNGGQIAVVQEGNRVEYEGETTSFTALTTKLHGKGYDIQPAPHWTYLGRGLDEMYEETYGTTAIE